MIKRKIDKEALKCELLLLVDIQNKLKNRKFLSKDEKKVLINALGIREFRDEEYMERKLDEFIYWINRSLEKKD